MTDYAAKVAAGIKLLDSKKPGWRSKIVMDELDLGSCDVCVLGQVFGSYDSGKYALDLDTYEAKDYGFNTDYSMSELTKAWKDALGKNNVLVEKGEVYKDKYGYAVKVLATHIVTVGNETITAYIVDAGQVARGSSTFGSYKGAPSVLRKVDFEQTYTEKVEKFTPKKGMFLQGASGKAYYMCTDDEIREVKDGAYATWLTDMSAAERSSLKELFTGVGKKFSDTVVK
ncbi:hypothetical protein SEA_STELLA_85 [Streptomyces phage Stella]|nr:hypothetical protein SEA_STELLA_85 [Streptomyces phage Stella]